MRVVVRQGFYCIGIYCENAIAIESETKYPFGGNVYYVTMQITLHIPECARKERNLHCDVVHITTNNGSFALPWITRSQRSRSRRLDRSIASPRTSLATLMGVMWNTSQCELRSLRVNSGMLNAIRIVTYYTLPPLESPDSSWIAMAFSR